MNDWQFYVQPQDDTMKTEQLNNNNVKFFTFCDILFKLSSQRTSEVAIHTNALSQYINLGANILETL